MRWRFALNDEDWWDSKLNCKPCIRTQLFRRSTIYLIFFNTVVFTNVFLKAGTIFIVTTLPGWITKVGGTFWWYLGNLSKERRRKVLEVKDFETQRVYWWKRCPDGMHGYPRGRSFTTKFGWKSSTFRLYKLSPGGVESCNGGKRCHLLLEWHQIQQFPCFECTVWGAWQTKTNPLLSRILSAKKTFEMWLWKDLSGIRDISFFVKLGAYHRWLLALQHQCHRKNMLTKAAAQRAWR